MIDLLTKKGGHDLPADHHRRHVNLYMDKEDMMDMYTNTGGHETPGE